MQYKDLQKNIWRKSFMGCLEYIFYTLKALSQVKFNAQLLLPISQEDAIHASNKFWEQGWLVYTPVFKSSNVIYQNNILVIYDANMPVTHLDNTSHTCHFKRPVTSKCNTLNLSYNKSA